MVRESVECLSVKSPGCSVDVLISLLISLRPDIHTHTHNHANQKDTGFFWYWSNWTVMWPPNPPPSKHTHPFWRSIVGGLFNPLIKEHRGGCNPVTARRVMWGMRCVCVRERNGKREKQQGEGCTITHSVTIRAKNMAATTTWSWQHHTIYPSFLWLRPLCHIKEHATGQRPSGLAGE